MITLEEIRLKYPSAHRAPDPDCERCHGEGEYQFNDKTGFVKTHVTPCACIFFAPEEMWIPKLIGKWAGEQRRNMDSK
jgi:hypothetical protein